MTRHHTTTVTVYVVNGFTKDGQGGNPAGVVLDADNLSADQMQLVAKKMGLSETAFVSQSETEGFKLDFFTPNRRIAHCGHATIAAFSNLAQIGRVKEGVTSKETVDGPRKIIIEAGAAYMEQTAPQYTVASQWPDGMSVEKVLAALGLSQADIIQNAAPIKVNTGNSFLVVGVHSANILNAIQPDFDEINTISEAMDLIGFYIFTPDTSDAEIDATTRMFAPRYGIQEESATGMAAGPLACLLHDQLGQDQKHFVIEQGKFMSRPSISEIKVKLKVQDGQIESLMAGGSGAVISNSKIKI